MENSFLLLPIATVLKSTESPVWLRKMLLHRVAGESPSSACLLDPQIYGDKLASEDRQHHGKEDRKTVERK